MGCNPLTSRISIGCSEAGAFAAAVACCSRWFRSHFQAAKAEAATATPNTKHPALARPIVSVL